LPYSQITSIYIIYPSIFSHYFHDGVGLSILSCSHYQFIHRRIAIRSDPSSWLRPSYLLANLCTSHAWIIIHRTAQQHKRCLCSVLVPTFLHSPMWMGPWFLAPVVQKTHGLIHGVPWLLANQDHARKNRREGQKDWWS